MNASANRGATIFVLCLWWAAANLAHAQCTGDDCAPPPPPPTSYGATESAAVSPDALLWPVSPPTVDTVMRPRLARGHDLGLVAVGVALLASGVTLQLVAGAFDQAAQNCRNPATFRPIACDSYAFGLVPFAGGFLVGLTSIRGERADIGTGILAGPVLFIPQAVGLVLLMFAVHGYTEQLVPGVTATPYVSSTDAGLTLTASF